MRVSIGFRQQGFSLVELTVVLLLITLLASVAVRETNELAFQTRYEQTKERLEMIRQAILGNPKQIVNGQQAISGFVADMGRLPDQLHELFQPGVCQDSGGVLLPAIKRPTDCISPNVWVYLNVPCSDNLSNTKQLCDGASAVWLGKDVDFSYSGLSWGWQGPYLSISGNPLDMDAFTDGWGNQATAGNDQNYGWRFEDLSAITANASDFGNLIVQSQGKNQQFDNSLPVTDDYDADFPVNLYLSGTTYYPKPVVTQKDWQVDISGGINANFARSFRANAYCGFLDVDKASFDTQQKCENGGGTWSAGTCTAIDESSCKSVGGKWQSCFFSPAACSSAGGVSNTDCQFTQKSCDIAGASASYIDQSTCQSAGAYWDTVSSKCHAWDGNNFSSTYRACLTNSKQELCVNAGGSWNATSSHCDFTNSSCVLAGGAWIQDCTFVDQTACETGAGGTWHNTVKPNSCVFTQAKCTSLNGISNGSDCYMSHAESIGTRYLANSCQSALGKWTGQICMNVFYRDAATNSIKVVSSAPVFVDENGAFATQLFKGFNIGGISVSQVPIGQNAIGIYEYDGDCDPVNNPLYPADRQGPIQVDFRPHSTLPVINW